MGKGGPRAVSSHRSAPEISGAISAAIRSGGSPYCVISGPGLLFTGVVTGFPTEEGVVLTALERPVPDGTRLG